MSVYLYLFHGRASIDQDMTDWGAEGPKIGPLSYVHTTYGSDVKIRGSREVLERFFPKALGWTPPDGIDVPEWRC